MGRDHLMAICEIKGNGFDRRESLRRESPTERCNNINVYRKVNSEIDCGSDFISIDYHLFG